MPAADPARSAVTDPSPGRPVPAPATWPAARWWTTERDEGDFAIDGDPAELAARRRAVVDRPWVWLRQVHGAVVHVVDGKAADAVRGLEGDALVTRDTQLVLAVQTADCGPVVLTSEHGVVGVAHAGWRGIEAGVLEATVAAMRELGAGDVAACLGPCIHADCYEFTGPERDALAARLDPAVAARTSWGTPALDVPAAVRAVLAAEGVRRVDESAGWCTACEQRRAFSYRARGETGRMATAVWRVTS